MDAARDLLRQRVAQQTGNTELEAALITLGKLAANGDVRAASELLSGLEARGLWGTSEAEQDVTEALRAASGNTDTEIGGLQGSSSGSERFTLVLPPPPTSTSTTSRVVLRTDSGRLLALPPGSEVAEDLERVAFLHVLATAPERVVPPGKSLRSALAGTEARRALGTGRDEVSGQDVPTVTLQEKVEEIVHRAFWDEALESLASPTPSQQLARLKRLYADLHAALSRPSGSSLLPPSHPALIALSTPLSPTPAPLRSARRHLAAIAVSLRERCAPVRDEALDDVISSLGDDDNGADSRRRAVSGGRGQGDAKDSDLPTRIVSAFRALLHIAELMHSDLSSAVLARVSDDELTAEISRAAREGERTAVLSLCGLEAVRRRWEKWVREGNGDMVSPPSTDRTEGDRQGDVRWMARLVQALGADTPVECPLPDVDPPPPSTSSADEIQSPTPSRGDLSEENAASEAEMVPPLTGNVLPPPFLFAVSDLLRLQNRLQALVIAAVLRTLVPLRSVSNPQAQTSTPVTPGSVHAGPSTVNTPFAERVLTLLMSEVDEDAPDAGTTKLAHLADEVVREHRRLTQTPPPASSSSVPSPASTNSTPAQPASTQSPFQHQLDEPALRARVDALLRSSSPVFTLLRLRLLRALSSALAAAATASAARREDAHHVPEVMQTGRDSRDGRERMRLRPDPSLNGFLSWTPPSQTSSGSESGKHRGVLRRAIDADLSDSTVAETRDRGAISSALRRLKGYEEPALRHGVQAALSELADAMDWVRETWGDILSLGKVV